MTALTQDRNTLRRDGNQIEPPVAAATKIFGGSIVHQHRHGLRRAGIDLDHAQSRGRCRRPRRQQRGRCGRDPRAAAQRPAPLRQQRLGRPHHPGDIGSDCYIVDDQTVAKTSGTNTRSVAGKVFDVDADGVWVDFA